MRISGIVLTSALLFAGVVDAAAQRANSVKPTPAAVIDPQTEPKAAGFLYKGIGIGAAADDVRAKLGEPKDKTDPQDLFVFSDSESAQFIYGPDKKVSAIMITFTGKLEGAPTTKDVFGEDVAARPDGGISKMVRYEKAGFWIAYNKIVGDESMISIAMQKIQ
jgi:hypothetical protein